MDLPGFGLSSRPELRIKYENGWWVDTTAGDIEEFYIEVLESWFQKMGLDKFILLGVHIKLLKPNIYFKAFLFYTRYFKVFFKNNYSRSQLWRISIFSLLPKVSESRQAPHSSRSMGLPPETSSS